jgi:hypothetical protein
MNLLLGPYLGEFGYELMHFQGAVRAFLTENRHKYKQIIVGCRKGNEYLYELATDFWNPNIYPLDTQGMCCRGVSRTFPTLYVDARKPCKSLGVKEIPAAIPIHKKFGVMGAVPGHDILFHARNSFKYSTASRNWIPESWDLLAEQFKGLRIGCIGTKQESLHVKGTEDLRGMPLVQLVDVIASSKVVVGPVSGAMHLTALCGTPHIVWTNTAKWAGVGTNRNRCEKMWNPFETKVMVLDKHGWKPPVEVVFDAIKEFL